MPFAFFVELERTSLEERWGMQVTQLDLSARSGADNKQNNAYV